MKEANPHNWINENQELVRKHKGEWIAISSILNTIIAHSPDIDEVISKATESGKEYALWRVPKTYGKVHFL